MGGLRHFGSEGRRENGGAAGFVFPNSPVPSSRHAAAEASAALLHILENSDEVRTVQHPSVNEAIEAQWKVTTQMNTKGAVTKRTIFE